MTKQKQKQKQKPKPKPKPKKGAASVVVVAEKDRSSDRDSSETDVNTASSSDAQMLEFSYHSVINYDTMNYKSNCHINTSEKLMQFPISKENSEQQDEYYSRLRCIYHQNVLRLEEPALEGDNVIYLTALREDVLADILAPVSSLLDHSFFTPEDFYHSMCVTNFRKFARDVTNGLVEIHKHDVCHGNLSLETILFYLREHSIEPLFKLCGFVYRSGDKEELMLRDWSALASLIEAYMETRSLEWSDKRMLVELRHLLDSLKSGNVGLDQDWTRKLTMSEKSEFIQQFVLSHPAMLDSEERPSYIMSSVSYLEKRNMMRNIKTIDVMYEDQELTIDDSIVGTIIEVGGIPMDVKDIDFDDKGRYYVKMVRNQSGHQPHNKDPILAAVMGNTSIEIDQYFRNEQPNVVLALYKALKGTTFKFAGFLSL